MRFIYILIRFICCIRVLVDAPGAFCTNSNSTLDAFGELLMFWTTHFLKPIGNICCSTCLRRNAPTKMSVWAVGLFYRCPVAE